MLIRLPLLLHTPILCTIINIGVITIRTSINMDTLMYTSYMIMLLRRQQGKGCEKPLNDPLQVVHILFLGSASATERGRGIEVWKEKENVNARGTERWRMRFIRHCLMPNPKIDIPFILHRLPGQVGVVVTEGGILGKKAGRGRLIALLCGIEIVMNAIDLV
jgi:hypothetical protein